MLPKARATICTGTAKGSRISRAGAGSSPTNLSGSSGRPATLSTSPPATIHQHFNAGSEKPARIISATNRVYKWSGLNNLEQLENAPEYDAGISLQDLLRRLTFDVVR